MSFLNNLSLKVKLISLCGFLSLVSVVIAGVSYQGLSSVGSTYGNVTGVVMPKLDDATLMFTDYLKIRTSLRTLGLPGIPEDLAKQSVDQAVGLMVDYETAEERYVARGFIEGQKPLYDDVHSTWTAFKVVGARVLAHHKSGTPEDRQAMSKVLLIDCPAAAKNYEAAVKKLIDFHRGVGKARVETASELSVQTNMLVLTLGIGGIIIGMILGTLFANSISKSISLVVDNLTNSVEQVSSASTQIASSSEELSQATTEQAASLEETASSLEEITAMIGKATESANSASSNSAESQRKADEGRKAVDEMLTSMDEISQSNDAIMGQVSQSNQQMAEIVRVIQEIGNKTKVINEIVFQTKLLSFNASVEAARAGEHGKGFAVVAEEVGNLAQMSGNAAKEISDMLDSSISRVEKIVSDTKTGVSTLVDEGKRKVESGVAVANQCSSLLNDIVQNVSLVSGLAHEIAVASKEQSQGVGEINKAIAQLDTVTQQNASNSQQTATAAEDLSAQAETLKNVVSDLVVTVLGASAASASQRVERKSATSSKSRLPSSVKPGQNREKVLPLMAAKKVQPSSMTNREFKAASGGDQVPRRDDDGFRDI